MEILGISLKKNFGFFKVFFRGLLSLYYTLISESYPNSLTFYFKIHLLMMGIFGYFINHYWESFKALLREIFLLY